MKKDRIQLPVFTAITCVWLIVASPVTADESENPARSGEKGAVTLTSETRVGHLTLQPGRYWIQHRSEGFKHFIHFTEITRRRQYFPGVPTVKGYPGEAECQVQPLPEIVSRTTIYTEKKDGGQRLTRIEIAGEKVAHLF